MDPIITAEELADALRGPEGPRLVFVDVRRSHEAFLVSHLAGARWVDLDTELAGHVVDPAQGGRHPLPSPEAFARTLGRLGIEAESRVVVYDDQGGALAAARLWWMLRAYEHPRVRVLDGGWQALQAAASAGLLTLASGPAPDAITTHPVREWRSDEADVDDVAQLRLHPDWRVLDVRAAERFLGQSEPIDPIAGHVPGAINVPYGPTNLDAHGRFLDAATLRARYEAIFAGCPAEQVIVHCGSGVTACHTLLALERAGLTGALLYVGSWGEWCRRPSLPREPAAR